MNLITIENGYYRYKTPVALEPGEYIVAPKPTAEMKRYYPFIATSGPRGFQWLLPAEDWVLERLYGLKSQYEVEPIDTTEAFKTLEDFKEILRPWQSEVVQDVFTSVSAGKPFRKGLIVGLGGGKTLVALILGLLGESVYIAPRHLHGTVKDEAKKWGLPCPKITTPESARKITTPPTVAIIDECLSIKNPKAARSKAVTKLVQESSVCVAMTGTPMSAEHDKDLRWLRVCGSVLPAEEKYMKWAWGINPHHVDLAERGVKMPTNERGEALQPLEVDGWKHDELAEFLAPHLKIVDIQDIMAEIPEATSQIIEIPAPGCFRAILRGLLTQKSASKRLTQARACSSGFVYSDDDQVIWVESKPPKIEWVKKFIENNPGEPIVLFSGWRAEVSRLAAELAEYKPAVIQDGQSSQEVERFTNKQTNVMVCSAALTEGMNLQRARIAIFCSNSTSPVKREQAEGRVYRQGQTRGVVFYDLVCKGTLDSKALQLLQKHKNESSEYIKAQLAEELKLLLGGKS